ncbi:MULTISPECIES: prohibitin family protein [Streptomyces]|uniref:prohibitin family protein n=1 Tax=Streptomyces TaxID=1883 RepID=UPI0013180BF9|nr:MULTISPECIES: prohibitin family protein [Streptomyces]QGZ49670.1 prohibitin family protein [Streptomyces sp. QHH-9511]GGT70071.1 eukaryotic hypersensitive-induced response-like protein [Streptomyces lateritius]
MFVVSILLLIAAVVLFFVARANDTRGLRLGALGALIAGVFAMLASTLYVVSAYEVGVPVAFGKVGSPMTSGMHIKSPFTDVTTFSTRPVDLNLSDKDVVEVRSSQGGVMEVEVTVKWAVTPAKAVELYRLAGSEEAIQQRLVYPDSREIVRNVFARYTSEQGYATDREKINAEIGTLIKERLAPRGIDVTAVNLRNVKPSAALQDQIDRKIQQQQATERATEASRTAKAEADRRRIEAEGIARANKILNESLTDKVLMNQCIDAYKEAAGKNPVYAVPCGGGSGTPLIVDGTKR